MPERNPGHWFSPLPAIYQNNSIQLFCFLFFCFKTKWFVVLHCCVTGCLCCKQVHQWFTVSFIHWNHFQKLKWKWRCYQCRCGRTSYFNHNTCSCCFIHYCRTDASGFSFYANHSSEFLSLLVHEEPWRVHAHICNPSKLDYEFCSRSLDRCPAPIHPEISNWYERHEKRKKERRDNGVKCVCVGEDRGEGCWKFD